MPSKTPVSILQELLNRRGLTPPKYQLVQIEGTSHEPIFRYRVNIEDLIAMGTGRSKKEAKHAAAKGLLDLLIENQNMDRLSKKGVVIANEEPMPEEIRADDKAIDNPIGWLQEMCMSRYWSPPLYEMENEEGLPHLRQFTIACEMFKHREVGTGKSKKLAKRQAALKMWQYLQELPMEENNMTQGLDDDDEEITKLDNPLGICSMCEKYLDSFCKIKQNSVGKNLRLGAISPDAQCNRVNNAQHSEASNIQLHVENRTRSDKSSTLPTNDQNVKELGVKENFSDHELKDNEDTVSESATRRKRNHNFEEHINRGPMEENSIYFESYTEKGADSILIKEEFNDNVRQGTDKNESRNDNINSNKSNQVINDYECPICHEFFINIENLLTHMKISHTKIFADIRKAQCHLCNIIVNLCNLRRHLKIHIGIKEFHCSICKKSFTTKNSLQYHDMTRHVKIKKKEFTCDICHKQFSKKSTLKKHTKTHLNKNYRCPVCNEPFTDDSCFLSHYRAHITNQLHTESVNTEINSATPSTENENGDTISAGQETLMENYNDLERTNNSDKDYETAIQERSDQKFKEIYNEEEPMEEDFTSSDSYFNKSKKHIEERNWEKLKEIEENSTDSDFHNDEIEIKEESVEENSNDREFYEKIVQDVVKDESVIDNNSSNIEKGFESENEAPITKNFNDEISFEKEQLNEKSKDLRFEYSSPIFEEIYIKNEPMEENSSDSNDL